MPTIYLTRGLPGSGKSTFAKRWVQEHPDRRVRINRDDLRGMLYATSDKKLDSDQEAHVSAIEKASARAALNGGQDVIIDATNLNPRFVKQWTRMGHPVVFLDFPVSLETALAQNAQRDAPIPEDVIRGMFRRYTSDGALPAVPLPEVRHVRRVTQDWRLPSAVLVDIDGTLAQNVTGRSFYDMSRVGEDAVNVNIRAVVNSLHSDHQVFVFSGRDERARDSTLDWLTLHIVNHDGLFMRSTNDTRPDDTVKIELFDAHIRDRFNVIGVIDDRPQVCRAWRALGLTTLQVGDPTIEF